YPNYDVGGGLWSTPAIDPETNTVFITTGTGNQDESQDMWGSSFMALDVLSLAIKAYFVLPTGNVEDDIEWGSSPTLFSTLGGTKLVAATGKDGVLYALRRSDLSLVWSLKIAVGCICPECGCGSISTPAFDGRTLFVGAGVSNPEEFAKGTVYAVDPL